VDTEADPDVEKVEDENSKKVEVTDLVKSQKSVEEKQDEYFENLFNHLNDLESKLSAMDGIIEKLNNIETKIEKYRTKTPEEKLELRTLDSGPFNQKLSQFFEDKEEEMEMTGKNEYVLTPDEVESYSPSDIKRSFRNFGEDEMTPEDDMSKFKKIY
jgi:predicted RNase H-like nuclease (RuvC/YqgF family)